MALTPFAFKLIAPRIKGAVLSFGYPDILMSPAEASEVIGKPLTKSTPFGGSHKRDIMLADTEEVFQVCGATFMCLDLIRTRDAEQIVDLNYPLDVGQYDLVVDAGTIEHCANIGQALMNAANAVQPGGYVFHGPPLTMLNHGFYNVSPTLLMDFYCQNGWRVEHLSGHSAASPYVPVTISEHARFTAPHGTAMYFLAKRLDDRPLKWPVQWKYLPKES